MGDVSDEENKKLEEEETKENSAMVNLLVRISYR